MRLGGHVLEKCAEVLQGLDQGVQLLLSEPLGGAVDHAGVELAVEGIGLLPLVREEDPDDPPVPRLAAPLQVALPHQGVHCGGQGADPDRQSFSNGGHGVARLDGEIAHRLQHMQFFDGQVLGAYLAQGVFLPDQNPVEHMDKEIVEVNPLSVGHETASFRGGRTIWNTNSLNFKDNSRERLCCQGGNLTLVLLGSGENCRALC